MSTPQWTMPTERQLRALKLREGGLSYFEIAQLLGYSYDSGAARAVSKARKKLAEASDLGRSVQYPARSYEHNRDRKLKQKFGISLEVYESLLEAQNGVCAICGEADPQKALAVDHDHDTGRIRGLLCTPCNRSLGRFEKIGIGAILAYLVASEQLVGKEAKA